VNLEFLLLCLLSPMRGLLSFLAVFMLFEKSWQLFRGSRILSSRKNGVRLSASSTPVERRVSDSLEKTGAFKTELPDVFVSSTHFRRAQRGLKEMKGPDMGIKNQRERHRRYSATTLDALMKGLTVPITAIMKSYKRTLRNLHPFEATVADLVVKTRVKKGEPDLGAIMADLKSLRAETSKTGKEYASKAKNAATAIEAKDTLEEGTEALKELYNATTSPLAQSMEHLVALQKDLRRIPVLELDTLTVVLVGTPNVGKSSIVRAVSTGTPEVNNYPFTTRGVTIGHILDEPTKTRFQVMDTPGLLDRPIEERNEMEKLTFASLAHLPTAVIFVIDPSGLAGEQSNLQAQLNVREYLRSRFPRRPWLDVMSKADLDIPQEILSQMPEGHLQVSVADGHNMEVLKARIEGMLTNDLTAMLTEIENMKAAAAAEEGEEEEEVEPR
jgi:nucleolar GTP-binding protein